MSHLLCLAGGFTAGVGWRFRSTPLFLGGLTVALCAIASRWTF